LKLAKKIGADHTVLVTRDTKEEEMVNKIHQLFGKEPEITIECSGAPPSLRLALLATKEGGTVLIVGCGPKDVNLPIAQAAIREVNILGSFRYRNWYGIKNILYS
jgi:L-iditol 2-dehydrogenase